MCIVYIKGKRINEWERHRITKYVHVIKLLNYLLRVEIIQYCQRKNACK